MFALGASVSASICPPFVVGVRPPHFLLSVLKEEKNFFLNDLIKTPRGSEKRGGCRGRGVGHTRASLNKEALCSPPTVSD